MSQPVPRARSDVLARVNEVPAPVPVAVVSLMLVGAWVLSASAQTEQTVLHHLFYLPIVLASVRFGAGAGVLTAVVAAVLSGPLAGSSDPLAWSTRGGLFVLVALIVGFASTATRASVERDRETAQRERALIGQRAALVQLVSHEFRTPLTIIRGSMETLRRRNGVVAPEFRTLVDATDRSVTRLEEMVDVVLAAADELDIDDTNLTDVPVDDLIQHAAVSIRSELVDRLLLDVPAKASVVTVEPYLWLTVRCLLDNALKFSPDGEPIEVTFRRDGDDARLSLHDHGPGFPPGFEQVAFDPFTQADTSVRREFPGLGMGLYTARRLARRLGGDIEVTSRAGQGVTATVVLPQRSLVIETNGRPRRAVGPT